MFDQFPLAEATPPIAAPDAWQRWEMTDLAEELPPEPAQQTADPDAATTAPAPTVQVDEAELARLRGEARQAGQAQGHQEGHAEGFAQGQEAGMAAVREQAAQLQALARALPDALRAAESQLANELLALALDLAKQVLGQALAQDPTALLAVVRELLQAEPALTGAPQLQLHPDDAALVKQHLTEDLQAAGWRIRADATMPRGGCRVQAASGERDATLETRWERVAAALARHTPAATGSGDD